MCHDIDMDVLEIITNALIAYGYSRQESELIIAKLLEEEAKDYLDSLEESES
jgi:hypothetical protein